MSTGVKVTVTEHLGEKLYELRRKYKKSVVLSDSQFHFFDSNTTKNSFQKQKWNE